MAARSSDIPATRIPKITDLRDRLNYGNSRLSRYSAFSDDLRVFRRKFVSKDLTGEDLWDWKSSEHQAALNAMTHAFLENHGYGELYWPSDPTSPNFNSLQYSKHRALIARTIKQLIFRTNLQQYRNKKYKQKDEHQSDPKFPEIIDLEAEEEPYIPSVSAQDSSSVQAPIDNYTRTSSTAVYDGPKSPEHEAINDTGQQPTQTKRKLDASSNKEPTKRSKLILKFSTNKAQAQNTNQPVSKPQQTTQKTKWTSPRNRRTVRDPDYVDMDELDRAIASETKAAELASDRNDTRPRHQTSTEQSSVDVDYVLHHIRTTRPSETRETAPPTPTSRQRRLTQDSQIDPSLERIFPPSSSLNSKPPSSISSSVVPTLQSPVSTPATFQPVHETIPQATTLAQPPASTTTTFQPVRETIPQATTLAQSSASSIATSQLVRETIPQATTRAQSPASTATTFQPVRETIPQATTIAQSPSSTTTTLQPVRETIPQATTLAQSPPSTTTTLPPVHETISQTTILAQSPTQQDVHASTVPPVKPSPAPSSTKARDIPAPPKLNVDFNYAVILSRTPKFHCKTWTPRGHFLDKSLDELITELPFDNHQNITGLKVCLEGPWAKVEESLKCNEEAKFEITKGRFLKAVRRCLKNQNKMNPGKTLAMNFEVEALRDDEFEKDEDDDDDDDDINDILF